MKTITTSKGEFVFVPADQPYLTYKMQSIGLCSEIIKNEELAKRVVDSRNWYDPYMTPFGYETVYKDYLDNKWVFKATEAFASLLQANDIELNEQDWFVVKKI